MHSNILLVIQMLFDTILKVRITLACKHPGMTSSWTGSTHRNDHEIIWRQFYVAVKY